MITCSFQTFGQQLSRLDIEFNNIRNQKGVIRLSLYTNPDQYPYHPSKTFEIKKDSLTAGTLKAIIPNLQSGEYGLCFLDDENRSGDMDTNIIGIPQEGFGFANNPKPFLKRPDYEHVVFKLVPGINHLQLITRYKN